MKKFLIFLGILIFLGGVYFGFYRYYLNDERLVIEEDVVQIDNIYIYGSHLNLEGNVFQKENVDLVLYNGNFTAYEINIKDNNFNLSDYINDGIYLDDIDYGDYYLFLRYSYTENGEIKYKYYALNNETDYDETTYYTFNRFDKKIVIDSEKSYPTMMMHVSKNDNNNVYDIVIDPGHGGIDSGAYKFGYKEADLTMQIAEKLVDRLNKNGIKAKLTRTSDKLSQDEKMPEYGKHGRAVIPHEVHAKYIFSIHLNSSYYSNVKGLEIYTAKNMNYDFAKNIADNIIVNAKTNYSNNTINMVAKGIYSRNFTDKDIEDSIIEKKDENLIPYDITTNSAYYYIIRETGGIVTGAYVDDRNGKDIYNPYCYSNVGTEAYLLELGYLSNKENLNNIINNMDGYVDGIYKSIQYLYNK